MKLDMQEEDDDEENNEEVDIVKVAKEFKVPLTKIPEEIEDRSEVEKVWTTISESLQMTNTLMKKIASLKAHFSDQVRQLNDKYATETDQEKKKEGK